MFPLFYFAILFKTSPCIPAVFLIHERKLQSTHEELMRFMTTKFPILVNGNGRVSIVLSWIAEGINGLISIIYIYLYIIGYRKTSD